MSDSTQTQSVLIISEDKGLVESLINKNNSDQEFLARDSIQFLIDEPKLLETNSLIIFDIETNDTKLKTTLDNILKIKQQDPAQVLMLVGEQDSLAEVLKSKVQPLIYRAFSKPASPNQIFLAFKSANALHDDLVSKRAAGIDISTIGPEENKTNVASISGERRNNSAIYAAVGVVALAIVGWLLFSSGSDQDDTVVVDVESTFEDGLATIEPIITTSETVQRINDLNQNAANALLDERVIAPKGDNALWYYNQVLAIDAYDTTAYEGKKNIADRLRTSYNTLVSNAEFDRALKVINVLKRIEPLNVNNDSLRGDLEEAINVHVLSIQESGTSEDIAETTAVLQRIGADLEGSKSASEALQAEKAIVDQIDAAIEANILIPPVKGNAYSFVSGALKDNTVSKANIEPRVSALSSKLLVLANASIAKDNVEEASKLAALIKRLNVDKPGLAKLNKNIIASKKAQDTASAKEVAKEAAEAIPAKIIPAKIINRTAPKYPSRALTRSLEGWVQVGFMIDTKGKPVQIRVADAKPKGVFEKSALKAVESWRFSPARNEETGLAVVSNQITTKVQFILD